MPSIAAFVNGLLAGDMYSEGEAHLLYECIGELNDGQLKLLIKYCERTLPGLSNPMWVDSHQQLLKASCGERDRREEERGRAARDELINLTQAHTGLRAKVWDKKHAKLDKELGKFQKFLKERAHKEAEDHVRGEERKRMYAESLDLPERAIKGRMQKRILLSLSCCACMFAPSLMLLPAPIELIIVLLVGVSVSGCLCCCLGMLKGAVKIWPTDEEVLEKEIKARQKTILKGYEKDMRTHYEEFEAQFEEDMAWRDNFIKTQRMLKKTEKLQLERQANLPAAGGGGGEGTGTGSTVPESSSSGGGGKNLSWMDNAQERGGEMATEGGFSDHNELEATMLMAPPDTTPHDEAAGQVTAGPATEGQTTAGPATEGPATEGQTTEAQAKVVAAPDKREGTQGQFTVGPSAAGQATTAPATPVAASLDKKDGKEGRVVAQRGGQVGEDNDVESGVRIDDS